MVCAMTITPTPVPPDRQVDNDRPRVRYTYPWDQIQLGVWQCWVDLTTPEGRAPWQIPADAEVADADALRLATRVRLAARAHAETHGLTVQSRRKDHGRILDLRFTRKEV